LTTIGIDPGKKGGLCALDEAGKIVSAIAMPDVLAQTVDWFGERLDWGDPNHGNVRVFIEQVGAMPGQGVTSMFTFGRGYGELIGIVAGLQIPYTLVRPQEWQKTYWPKSKGANTKTLAHSAVTRLYPEHDLRGTERSKKPHDGIVDAILIARWGHQSQWSK
jgi:crossover junction endodeoxyribonuclease RuvC